MERQKLDFAHQKQESVQLPSINLTAAERFEGISGQRIEELLNRIGSLRAGVLGDVCLDAYWVADLTCSVLSRETPHYTLPVVEEQYSPGAAGNVAANLISLGCREVAVCSVIGNDWRGSLLRQQLVERGIDTSYLLTDDDWITPAYCKPIRLGLQRVRQEDPRIDFQNFRKLPDGVAVTLAERLDTMAERCDIIAVTDQQLFGIIGEEIRNKLAQWAARGKIIVVDSREKIGLYKGVIVKPNEVEASQWFYPEANPKDWTLMEWAGMARRMSGDVQGVCCMTLGSEGAIWAEGERCIFVPTQPAEPPIDIVGAGDGFAAAMMCALGAGGTGPEAMAFAHLAASVVIRKIGTTGTASPQEIRTAYAGQEGKDGVLRRP